VKNKKLWISSVVVLNYFMAFYIILSILSRYATELGFQPFQIGILWSVVSIVAIPLRSVFGYLADITSRSTVVTLGNLALIIASINYALSNTYHQLLIARGLEGIASAMFISTSMALMVEVVEEDRIGEALGLRSLMVALGGIVGPYLGTWIVDNFNYKIAFLVPSFIASINIVLMLTCFRIEMRLRVRRYRSDWRKLFTIFNKNLVIVTISVALMGIVYSALFNNLQAHYRLLGYPATAFGLFSTTQSLSGIFTRAISGKLLRLYDAALLSAIGFLIMLSALATLSIQYEVPSSYIAAIIYGLGLGLLVPANQTIAARIPRKHRALIMGIYTTGFDIGGLIGPITYGYIAEIFGYGKSYLYLTIPLAMGTLLMTYLYIAKKP